ncbi:ComGF family competence protein [Aerococcaceae bacterium zg-ZUI334]|uniref:competence type IV pilus minor pilin ComGF n=1 Tax=Aerococcaceae TaxID=186827 RepID=UPI0013D424C9|nr:MULTISPECIES: ComGF family competence protein [unclassified Facklamia]MBR7926607.1 ComGF family competence protein [Aerococcaceae bacterium zg-ZUI334]QQD65198.1 ComGF family competence protein [Aerococcaceae bacterium zg-252]
MLDLKRLNRKGFILWEALLALLIISMMIHSLFVALTSYQKMRQLELDNRAADWAQLMVVLEQELKHYTVENVTPTQINLLSGKQPYHIVLQNHKLFKKPGHQPYAYDVKDWYVSYQNSVIEIILTYRNNQTFSGVIHLE